MIFFIGCGWCAGEYRNSAGNFFPGKAAVTNQQFAGVVPVVKCMEGNRVEPRSGRLSCPEKIIVKVAAGEVGDKVEPGSAAEDLHPFAEVTG